MKQTKTNKMSVKLYVNLRNSSLCMSVKNYRGGVSLMRLRLTDIFKKVV